ncbi:hypothetical protein [Paenibacillus agricola]|uniref:Uncharacterized protein n=1 Tax=Paenibacillus agricola TaxID=2716264 RepID=A0ABX0JM00_9BACL|nr:hypothetical protein [Paenibacillus agricola]NHN35336.1 hypothetical protein [Paenibacillus agricola]
MGWETIDSFNKSDGYKLDKLLEHLQCSTPHIPWRTVWVDYESGSGINLQVPVIDEDEALEIYESLDIDSIVGFILKDEDYYVINIVMNIIRQMLKHPKITAKQILGLGNALYAVERLPQITKGAKCIFSVNYEAGDDQFSEIVYFSFEISEESFGVSRGGSTCDAGIGSDSYSLRSWLVEAGGYSDTSAELYNLEDTVFEYLNLGADIEVDDESDIAYEG